MANDARKEYMKQYRLKNLDMWKRTPEQQAKINARRRENYAQNADLRDQARAKTKEWQRQNPDKRKAQRLKKFGLTLEEFRKMLTQQNDCCAICGYSDMSDRNFFPLVDHCHKTGRVRGLLCLNCNMAIGKMRDDPSLLANAILYLERSDDIGTTT
jgi:hypothetical protein